MCSVLSYSKCSLQCNTVVSLRINFNVSFCLCLSFKHMESMSSPQDFLGCTIMKKVEEHCTSYSTAKVKKLVLTLSK